MLFPLLPFLQPAGGFLGEPPGPSNIPSVPSSRSAERSPKRCRLSPARARPHAGAIAILTVPIPLHPSAAWLSLHVLPSQGGDITSTWSHGMFGWEKPLRPASSPGAKQCPQVSHLHWEIPLRNWDCPPALGSLFQRFPARSMKEFSPPLQPESPLARPEAVPSQIFL